MKWRIPSTSPDAVGAMQVFQILRQGGLVLIAVLLAKSPLPAAEIGGYEMLMFVGYAVSFFWITGLIQGMLSLYPKSSPAEQRRLLVQSYLFFLVLSLLVAGGLLVSRPAGLRLLTGRADLAYFDLFLVFFILHNPTYLLEHVLLLAERPRAIVRVSMASTMIQVAAVILPVYAGWGLKGSIAGLVVYALVRHIIMLVLVSLQGDLTWPGMRLRTWWQLSAPLILYAFLGGFHQTFDNWLVGWHYGGDEYQFALFRYGARELPLALALTTAMGTALLPRVAANVAGALPEVRRQSRKLFHQLFPATIILLLTSHWWFPRLFSPEFLPSVPIFNLFLLVTVSRVVLSRTLLMGLHDNRSILIISLVELAANAGLSLWLVQPLGLAGIAWGTLLAYSLEKILQCAYLYRRYGIGMGQYTDMRWLGGYSLLLIAAFLFAS